MKRFRIDFKKLGLLLLPPQIRQPYLAALVYAAMAPFSSVQVRLKSYVERTTYLLTHTSQKCYMEKALNDEFDYELRGIRVRDVDEVMTRPVFWERGVGRAVFFPRRGSGTSPLFPRRDFADIEGVDFYVLVPPHLLPVYRERIKAVVNTYKLASKRYKIQ